MTRHVYKPIIKFIYSYGNFFINILMIFNLLAFLFQLKSNYVLIFPIIITVIILYLVNRFYFIIYKTLPLEIIVEKERLILTNFIFNKSRKETIYFKDIKTISGGIFEGRLNGIMKITDKNNLSIAISHRINDSSKLIAKILEKVDKKLYDEVIENLNKLGKKLSNKTNVKEK